VLVPAVALAFAIGVALTVVMMRDAPEAPAPTTAARAEVEPAPAAEPAPAPEAPPADAARPRARRIAPPAPDDAPAATVPAPEAPAARGGTLRIDADVPGAQVFIDRVFLGTTPLVAENLEPGTHQLNVSAEGFDSIAQQITVEPGTRELALRFREVRLDASLDVIHRHGIGSCRGRLVATPQGLRFETTNRDDQFTTPLLDLEVFQVDYLEKNLRVKLLKGRQFNFTDPDGNADRLFVFHRDVDRARERLRRGDRPAAE
jgi:hypothetical protein